MEKLILWIFVCEVFEVEIVLALCSPQTFWQLTVSNQWSNKTYGYNMFTLKKKPKNNPMTLFQRNCWPHFGIINTLFLQWILTSLWWLKWIHQEWALLSLAGVQEDFPFLHPLAGAKQHLQPFDPDQNFLFLALRMPHPQFFSWKLNLALWVAMKQV